jgi:hypothetical protein
MLSALGPRMTLNHTYLMRSAYSSLSRVVNSVERILLLLKKSAPDSTSQLGWVTRGTYLNFSHNTIIEAVGLSQAFVDDKLLGLLSPYHQYAISTFNTCSRGLTHQSLTDKVEDCNLEGASLPHHTRWPFQSTILHFSPKSPARSQVNHPTITTWTRQWTNPKSREWEPPLDFY